MGGLVSVVSARRADDRSVMVLAPIAAIALLCAREHVDADPDGSFAPGRVDALRTRCTEVDDWEELVRAVAALRILPLVHQHLRQHAADLVPQTVLDSLAGAARRDALRNLQVVAVHLRLHRDVLVPLGVPHAFLKGTTLAHRHYEQPNLRVARDIDVLVPQRDLERIAHTLRDLGYRPKWPVTGTDDGIRYSARMLGEVDWVSPEGVLIEVHSKLVLEAGRLPVDRVLADADQVDVGGVALPTLGLADSVSHLCLHHTRSAWTRLSWVADLDALLRANGGDAAALVALARTRGFGRVVAASLELHRALARPDPCPPVAPTGSGDDRDRALAAELLDVCLAGLKRTDASLGAGPSAAVARRAIRSACADLSATRRLRVRVRSVVSRFGPQVADFLHLPLPARLHRAYYVLRPFLRLRFGAFRPAEHLR
jgi:hypothetical protein